ncbi:hypothetical protein FHS85_001174 [Rhodoligotrophos appendicifer]|uniref:hypothetical protein n=1 Tax=Rhodoligotrophos appendicifer TaxID=987056 RepID=UPI0011846EF1|nr:hypothetical protein [Rhodoligotrophos appendicifer]
MPVNDMMTRFWQQSGSQIHTVDLNFAPTHTFVTAALSGTTGRGTQFCGIVGARTRPRPGGEEFPETFGNWFQWRSSLFRQNMTSVTCGIATGEDQTAQGLFTLSFF